jgi:hypothetical protein
MFRFNEEVIYGIMVFSIPIIAIAGGIVAGIVKTLSRQRLLELAQRERIAAIERGLDPAKLPPLPALAAEDLDSALMTPGEKARRDARGLLVAGIIVLGAGIGIASFLAIIADDKNAWSVGLIPISVGIALLVSAWLVTPRGNGAPSGAS